MVSAEIRTEPAGRVDHRQVPQSLGASLLDDDDPCIVIEKILYRKEIQTSKGPSRCP